jgi:protein TonB
VQPVGHYPFQSALASGKQDYGNSPLVAEAAITAYIAVCLKTIDQTHRAVMPNKKAFGELSHASVLPVRESAEGKKHLVLLRFKAGCFRSLVATPKKLTDTIAQFGQCRVFGIANSPSHIVIVSYYDINANRHCFEASWSDIFTSNSVKGLGMYERNDNLVPSEPGPPRRPRPAKRQAAELGQRCKEPTFTANLSAAMLENNRMKRPKRGIDFLVAVSGHGLLLALAILFPLYFNNAIDFHQMETTYLVAPPLPPPPPAPAEVVHSIRRSKSFFSDNKLFAPRVIPKQVAEIKDLPNAPQTTAGVPGGVVGGVPGGQLGGVMGGILGDMGRAMPSPPAPKPISHRGPYRVGGRVQQPRIIQEVHPVYPILAKAVRVQGVVVIDSVIDANGDVTEMKLVSGNPLLVTAAFDAVRQWKYQPTLLNWTPVAVEMEVTVHFSLGS